MIEDENNLDLVAKTQFGLEEVLANELKKAGARDVQVLNRAVSFKGDKGFIYKANFVLRTALRILIPLKSFPVIDEQSLYDSIKAMPWEDFMHEDQTLAIDSAVTSEQLRHSQYISQKTKDAIVDRFREMKGKRPSVDLENPDLRINIHIFKNQCTVSLDSSGESLHKRGYRQDTNLAPMNEVLAAGLVLLSGWDGRSNFVDGMCGSGTILIEAAMFSANIPPAYFRKKFGFMNWKYKLAFDEALWEKISESALNKISDQEFKFHGIEISRNVSRKAVIHTKECNVDDMVEIHTMDFADFEPPAGRGTVIINPPYGERMDKDDIIPLYKMIGDTLKKRYAGYTAWVITSNMEAGKFIGLRPTRKIQLYNGSLECRFLKFELYEGSKKGKHLDKVE